MIGSPNNRKLLAGGAVVLLLGVVLLIWSGQPNQQGEARSIDPNAAGGLFEKGTRTSGSESAGTGATRRERPMRDSTDEENVQYFPLIERVLADESLSVEESARELRLIVDQPDVSLLEKEEALVHGLNLDFKQFTDLAANSRLPQPLALRLFDHMFNQNKFRNLQVGVCLDLMDHENEEIRSEALEQLAFYIGFEELVDQPDTLRLEAVAYLEDWANRPPVIEGPIDESAEIPETAPIEVVDEDQEEADDADDDE